VHLASDGVNDYTYELTSKGFVMKRTELATRVVTTTVFNPRRHRLNQQAGEFDFLVVFRAEAGGAALERIEVGGEIMEKYLYDDRGQLIGIQRHGEGERTLTYDESGRLMALEEKL
jgi:YD repeat-containing protein